MSIRGGCLTGQHTCWNNSHLWHLWHTHSLNTIYTTYAYSLPSPPCPRMNTDSLAPQIEACSILSIQKLYWLQKVSDCKNVGPLQIYDLSRAAHWSQLPVTDAMPSPSTQE